MSAAAGASAAAAGVALALIRHGPTQWNAARRIQGQTDTPLGAAGREAVRGWRLPGWLDGYAWAASPLRRARETARLLGVEDPEPVPALMEMRWGEWEGQRWRDLRRRLGERLLEQDARGLDFRPPGGEARREVQARLRAWFSEVARRGRPVAAVTHMGVIRATLAMATAWDMSGEPPAALHDACLHLFRLDTEGRPRAERLNVPLGPCGDPG